MNSYDKIIELVEKEKLTGEEKSLLDSVIKSSKEAKDFYDTYRKLKDSVNYPDHISYEIISEYILFKNGSKIEEPAFSVKIPQIENHLKECNACSKMYLELNEEYIAVDKFISGRFNKSTQTTVDKNIFKYPLKKRSYPTMYIFASLLVIGFLFFSLNLISGFVTTQTTKLAAIGNNSEFYISRGRATDDFQNSLQALDNGNYQSAVKYLAGDIKDNSNDETIFYSYYVLGLTHLKLAEKSFLGLFPSYDKTEAQKALESLEETIKLNDTGKYPNITLDAYFYTAKAYLMMNNKSAAEKYLRMVVKFKGSKMNKAEEILNELG